LEELRTLVLEAGNYIPKKHQSILLNLFDLESITVDDVMTPRNQIEALDIDAPPELLRQQIGTAYHRRLPVYQNQPDNIIGIILVRRLLNFSGREGITARHLRQIMREPYFIPAGTPLFTQLQQFQEHQDRLCFVVDEYGELMGLLTLEDIVEELIGEFATHSPLQSARFHRQGDGAYAGDLHIAVTLGAKKIKTRWRMLVKNVKMQWKIKEKSIRIHWKQRGRLQQ